MLNWHEIDTILFDMDGTLLDLHFDNYYWLELIPQKLAEKHGVTKEQAFAELSKKYQQVEGQIEWYCLDYWQQQLDLPIVELKQEIKHLITVREDVPEFLQALKKAGKKLILLTNAHPDSLSLKIEQTAFDVHLDAIVSTHEFGVSKESQSLWQQVEQKLGFDKERTLFVDDSLAVLEAAKLYGIKHLLAVANPDSTKAAREISNYLSIVDYRTLLPIN
ncbi:GMP/IMP nucleotidase [Pseudoalteromonas sp.]|uniref:GMP/IMP nucleotidase n=1 Tax=Pseudoalteromonas sp. TaxID=53249 RepID=UPI00356981AB